MTKKDKLTELFAYSDQFTEKSLRDLAIQFLNSNKFVYEEKVTHEGNSGQEHRLDFIIRGQGKQAKAANDSPKTGIILRDYRKSLGADGICSVERLLRDCPDVTKVVVMANDFSVPARNLAERCGVPVISRGELVSMLKQPNG